MTLTLKPIDLESARAILAGERPPSVAVADDYPTEFSEGVAARVGAGDLGPFFILEDGVVVGEVGGAVVEPGVVELGYAVVRSRWGRGAATAAVRAFVELARGDARARRLRGHTPLDRPASARVLEKNGFVRVGERDDEHEGAKLRVVRWELALR